MPSGTPLRSSIGSFALTCEATGNQIQLTDQEIGVMTSCNSWATCTLNAQLCLGVRLAEPSWSILRLNTLRWFQHCSRPLPLQVAFSCKAIPHRSSWRWSQLHNRG